MGACKGAVGTAAWPVGAVAPWNSTQFTMAALAASFSRLSVAQPSQSLSFSASMRASPITGASTETLKPHGPLPRPDLPLALQRPMHGLGRRPWAAAWRLQGSVRVWGSADITHGLQLGPSCPRTAGMAI